MRSALIGWACVLGVLPGCALPIQHDWSRIPTETSSPAVEPTDYIPLWDVSDCDGMEFVDGQGLVKIRARIITGFTRSGEEVVIYDRDTEGELPPEEQAERLRRFLKNR